MVSEFKSDMQTVESTHNRRQNEAKQNVNKLEQKVRKQTTVIDELKNLLQMAVKSD